MRILGLAALAGACLATSPLLAADLFESAPPPMDAPAYQSELGSNWYIRGDVGYGQTDQATVVPSAGLFPTIGNAPIGDPNNVVVAQRGVNKTTMSPDFNVGGGYRINDWFRVEADYQFSRGPGLGVTQKVYCPEIANAVSNFSYTKDALGNVTSTAIPVGYQYDYTTCDGKLNVNQYNNTALVMGYADLGHYGLFTPFVGAGVGLNANTIQGSLNFTQTDTGATYPGPAVSGSAPGLWVTPSGLVDQKGFPIYQPLPQPAPRSGVQQPIGPANWYRRIDSTKFTFAAAAAAGVGFKISQSATLDLQYKIMTLDITGGIKATRQSATIGVRYNLN